MNQLNRLRRVLLGTGTLVACTAVLLLGGPAAAHGNRQHEVQIKQYMFMPVALKIDQGDTVTWTNLDTAAHDVTVTAGPTSFHSPSLAQGKSWSHTFSLPGDYSYICSVHPDMKATITVAAVPVSRPAQAVPSPSRVAVPVVATTPKPAVRSQARAQAKPVTSLTRNVAAPKPALVSAPESSATLQPLILVVGAAVAVVMFCLLLMASRPVLVDDTELRRGEPKHLEEA